MPAIGLGISPFFRRVRSNWTPRYYVSNTGDDSKDGLSPLNAWRTIAKVNSMTFVAGDKIGFQKNGVWRETLIVPSSGTSDKYIEFGEYGSGALRPQILGSTILSTWNQNDLGVAANNDLMVESFEGTGYQSTWSEYAGSNAGCLVSEDNTDVARPAGGGNQVLKIVKVVTPAATSAGSAAKTTHTFATEQPSIYADFYTMIHVHGLASNTNYIYLFRGDDSSGQPAIQVTLYNQAGSIKIIGQVYTAGALTFTTLGTTPASGNITLDQWYHIQIKYDTINHSYSFTVDGTTILAGTLTDTHKTGIKSVFLGDSNNIFSATLYYDLLTISSTNFYVASTSMPANVWNSTVTVNDPYAMQFNGNVYFRENSGIISWGRVKKSLITDLAVEYDWIWFQGHICIYSPTDPNARYIGVETSQRTKCIELNNKEYLSIHDLEIAYAATWGIGDLYPPTALSGLIVKNCHIHHIGIKLVGYCIEQWHSNSLIQNNELHDAGRRNISLNTYSAAITVHDIIVERNTIYHGFHTTGLDICDLVDGNVNMDNIIIRYNTIYDDLTETLDNVESYSSNLIYIRNTGIGTFTNFYIYKNIFKGNNNYAINVQYPITMFIYNNTFYGFNAHTPDYHAHILMLDSVNAQIKNNIFYSDMDHAVNVTIGHLSIATNVGTVVCDKNIYYNSDQLSRLLSWKGTSYLPADWATYKSASGQDANSLLTDPLFVSSSDYNLQAGSPAIGAGVDVGLGETNPNIGAL